MNTFKLAKNAHEAYAAILGEIVELVKMEEYCDDCKDPMPLYERARLDAFRDMGLFLSVGKNWGKK